MLPRGTSRYDGTNQQRTPRDSGSASPGFASHLARCTGLILLLATGALPASRAQHGAHGGGGYHPASPHVSQPRMAQPRMQAAPRPVPQLRSPQATPARPAPYPAAPQNREQTPQMTGSPASGNAYPNESQGPRNQYAVPPPRPNQQHLGTWLQSHQGESMSSQENALRQEQGFSRLPQQQQQRLIDRLHQLDAMPPAERQRTIGRNENFERLTPDRRQAVRNSAQELNTMDPARKQQVRGAFRTLRDMPPAQRQQMLNSPEYRAQYNDHERQILGNLLSVEPYSPR